ncbi:hypothetical protein N9W89_00395 [Hellea sp.]|nr:hypothetical protein [Hellea sp.]
MSLKLKPNPQQTTPDTATALPFYGAPQSTQDALGLVALEPRILLDAAGFMTGADIAMDAMASGDAQLGVDAIFGSSDVSTQTTDVGMQHQELLDSLAQVETLESVGPAQDNNPTAAPFDGPWLNELDPEAPLNESDPTAAPFDGPWLDELTPEDANPPNDGGDPAAAPFDGPWLNELTPEDADTPDDGGEPSVAPFDGPWL